MTLGKRNAILAGLGFFGAAGLTAWFAMVPKNSVTASVLLMALTGLAGIVNIFPVSLLKPELLSADQQRTLGTVAGTIAAMAAGLAATHPSVYWLRVICGGVVAMVAALGSILPLNAFAGGFAKPGTAPVMPPPLPPPPAPGEALVTAPGPTIRKPAGRIDVHALACLAVMALAIVGCTAAFKQCELNALPQTSETLIADVLGIVANPASVVADLEALPDQPAVACVVAAVRVWMNQPRNGAKMLMAGDVTHDQHAHLVLDDYLGLHKPTACAGRATASVERVLR